MSPDMFFQVVVPLIGVKNTALLAITTPESGNNYFTDLMNLRGSDGEPLFLCVRVGMVCDSCNKNKRPCNHRLSMNPCVTRVTHTAAPRVHLCCARALTLVYVCVCLYHRHWKTPERTAKVDAM